MAVSGLLGGLIATALVLGGVFFYIRHRLRRFSSRMLGNPDILEALEGLDLEVRESPRSLNGCDSLLLPQILKDFPDFDPVMAKTYVREYLTQKFGTQPEFTVYNVVISRYLPSQVQKTIVFQAAVSWLTDGKRLQKRMDLSYTHLLRSRQESVAANCPNCGGALGYGETDCPYCGSRVANVLGNTWVFTELKET